MFNSKAQDDPVLSEFIDIVAEVVSDFTQHPEFPRFRIPTRATPLDPICDHVGLDVGKEPQSISRNLFMMEWDSLPGYSSFWHLHALRLPSGERVYWVDDLAGRKIIAVGPGGVKADHKFIRALFASNGEQFGTGILDSAPSRIRTCLRGSVMITAFLDAFYCAPNASDAIQFFSRGEVRRWLKEVLSKGGKELRDRQLSRAESQAEFLTLVENVVTDFLPHPNDPNIRVASRFTATGPLAKFACATRRSLPFRISRGLIRFAWWGAPGSTTTWEINAFTLPSGTSVYWIETDFDCEETEDDKRYIVATGSPESSDERFIELFFASNGKGFEEEGGVGVSPPLEVSTNLPRGEFLTKIFVSLFEAADSFDRLENYRLREPPFDLDDPAQRRELVERWLERVLI